MSIVGKDVATGISFICTAGGNEKWYSHFGRFGSFLNTFLPLNPATSLVGLYPTELKPYLYTKTCLWIFIVSLLILANNLEQPRCLSIFK